MDKKKLVIGILAHVDSGKTTLAESMLYLSGAIRRAGRVDYGDAFLDTDVQERARGITIFSKQAEFSWKEMDVSLLDTPGHMDFAAEMERTLQVLDYAVLVISGADGVQGHVMTLWKLLKRYRIPVFLFVNKMDQPDTDRQESLKKLQERLSDQCIDFMPDAIFCDTDFGSADSTDSPSLMGTPFLEKVAICDEKILEKYLVEESIGREDIASLIAKRKVFPCYFGSALKMEGVEQLLDGIKEYALPASYPDSFGARVYKIGRDSAGNRLTFMKITGGSLRVKQLVSDKEADWEEKADQIRIYSGEKYTVEQEVSAGTVCVVTGLSRTFSGEGLGMEKSAAAPLLIPVMTYRVVLPPEQDVYTFYKKLCQLEEEEPLLHVVWKEQIGEIHAQLMGEVQIEIIKNMIQSRFGVAVEFDEGSVLYKETIRTRVEGVGHFEPLRHYAEVHLLMEPLDSGSGLVFDTACSEDDLDRNWQRLVLTHLEEKEHVGILTGAPITDMKITLVAGRAHLKHTEGGDFRQATYRALRQGLHRAENVLLEPVYEFRIELPAAMIGRAMSDMQARHGRFDAPFLENGVSILTGTVPVVTMRGYQTELLAYSGGSGRLFSTLKGYEVCHNPEEVIAAAGYDAESDLDNPSSSVFCSHGAGIVVGWKEVESYMHIESVLAKQESAAIVENTTADAAVHRDQNGIGAGNGRGTAAGQKRSEIAAYGAEEKELDEIFARTYASKNASAQKSGGGKYKGSRQTTPSKVIDAKSGQEWKDTQMTDGVKKEYLLVDGYNIIFAWEELSELAKSNLDGARGALMDILSNYQGYRKMTLILVFDAYKVKGNPGSIFPYHNIHVVYTKEAETADQYIEKVTHEIGRKHQVTVATSDGLEQLIIMGQGAGRLSARELKEEIMSTNKELRDLFINGQTGEKRYLFDALSEELARHMEDVRIGRKEFESINIEGKEGT